MIVLELHSQDLQRIFKVDLMVYKYFKCSLYSFCEKYKYDGLFVEIIRQVTNDYMYEKLGYLEVELDDSFDDRYYEIESKYSSYSTDKRSISERIIALGVNWIVEDVLVHKSSGCFILTGCDNSRDLLSNPITNVPDIRYVGEGKSFYVEVCSDFNSFMKRFRRYDLRKIKFYKMTDMVFIDKQLIVLMFVDVVNKTYLRVPFNRLLVDIYRNGRDGLIDKYKMNTVCFEFDEDDELKPLDELFDKLKELSNGYISDNNDTYRVEKENKEDKERISPDEEDGKIPSDTNSNSVQSSVEAFETCPSENHSEKENLASAIADNSSNQLDIRANRVENKYIEEDIKGFYNQIDIFEMGIEEDNKNIEPDYPCLDMNPFTGEMDDFSPF